MGATTACGQKKSGPPSPTGPTSVATTLTEISAEARELVKKYNIEWGARREGGTVRWNQRVVTIWADSNFNQADVQAVVDFWNSKIGSVLTLQIVSTVGEAKFVLESSWPPPADVPLQSPDLVDSSCGVAGPRTFSGNMVTSARGWFAFMQKPQCRLGNNMQIVMAHEIGHALIPFGGHVPDGGILGTPSTWSMSPLTLESGVWINTVPPATKLE
ncbi:MAG TPA: hypothetical protein VGC58_01205 [Candidatus Paceibacterota bacterium]